MSHALNRPRQVEEQGSSAILYLDKGYKAGDTMLAAELVVYVLPFALNDSLHRLTHNILSLSEEGWMRDGRDISELKGACWTLRELSF
jgi:hypothetical protein